MLASLLPARRKLFALGSVALLGAAWGPQALAAGTAANTAILNTATATYTDTNSGTTATATSNTVTVQVDEILGVAVVSNNPGPVSVNSPDDNDVLSFTVSNPGNGPEAYLLAVNAALAGDQFDPTDIQVYLDANGNGVYDPGVDPLYVPGTNNPVLNPDQSIVVFVTGDTPPGQANGNLGTLNLTATAVTGSGTAGTTFAGQGEGGVDAVVGPTTATALASGSYLVTQLSTTLAKSQVTTDPFGGANAVPGAVITYTIALNATGTGALNGAAITDVIPANTTYVANSLRLNGTALTDATDADAGAFTGSSVVVNLGNLAAPANQTVSFQVRIN